MSRPFLALSAAAAVTLCLVAGPAAADHHKGDHKDGGKNGGKDGGGEVEVLFDGSSLDGWTKADENPDAFSLDEEKGAIKAQGQRCHLYYTGNDRPYRDFELTMQVMTEPNSNGGVYIHTRYQDQGWPAGGFECQVNNSYEKDPKKTGSLYAVSNVMRQVVPDNEWFDYTIRVEGNHIQTMVNGEVLVDYYEPEGATPGKGFDRTLSAGTFALQAHDPGSVVYYKDIQVKRLN